jgi:PilZ domain
MYVFQYRTPRFPTDFPVDLVVGETTLRGRCNNINGTGIQAEFTTAAVVGQVGMLTLTHTQDAMKLYARVTYFASRQTGLAFVFRTEHERAQLIRFVESLCGPHIGQHSRRALGRR